MAPARVGRGIPVGRGGRALPGRIVEVEAGATAPGAGAVVASIARAGRMWSALPEPATVVTTKPRAPRARCHLAASIETPSVPPRRNETMTALRSELSTTARNCRGVPVGYRDGNAQACIDHGRHGARRVVPGGVSPGPRLRGHRDGQALEHGELRAHCPHPGPSRARPWRPP